MAHISTLITSIEITSFNDSLNHLTKYAISLEGRDVSGLSETEKESKFQHWRANLSNRVCMFLESFSENHNPELLKTTISKVASIYNQLSLTDAHSFADVIKKCSPEKLARHLNGQQFSLLAPTPSPLQGRVLKSEDKFEKRLKKILNYAEKKQKELKEPTFQELMAVRDSIQKKVISFFESFKENLSPGFFQSTMDKIKKIYNKLSKNQGLIGGKYPHDFATFLKKRCSKFPLASNLIQSESSSSSSSSLQSIGNQPSSSSSKPTQEESIDLFNRELNKLLLSAQRKEQLNLEDPSQISRSQLSTTKQTLRNHINSFFSLFTENLNPQHLKSTILKVGTIYDEITKIQKQRGAEKSTDFVKLLQRRARLSTPLVRHITYKEFIGPNLLALNEAPPNPKKSKTKGTDATEQEMTGESLGMTAVEIPDDDVAMPAASSSSDVTQEAANSSATSKRKR